MSHNESAINRYYDTHPINEESILAKLKASGTDIDNLTEDRLKEFDQDHYGGIGAVELLIERAGIRSAHRVLDICAGVGGPARWIAHRVGCRVTGLDLTTSRVIAARRLTERVGLQDRVDFVEGDAMNMPLPDKAYDVIVGEEAWVHVPDKVALIRECTRVAKRPCVMGFTDIVARRPLAPEEANGLSWAIEDATAVEPQLYLNTLLDHGWLIRECVDLGEEWTHVLVDRLAMYRTLRDTTVAKFGVEHFENWDRRYAFFVDLYVTRVLTGVRIIADL
jgi:SAM-dependent methyltransferase